MTIPVYPSHFPCPNRFQYALDLNFNTGQIEMQSGWTQQRRLDPFIYRQLDVAYLMPIPTFWEWWKWVNRYGFGWWTGTLDGQEVTLRFISDIDFSYLDFANVTVTVRAERFISDEAEVSTDTPTIIDPLASVSLTQTVNDEGSDPVDIVYMAEPPAPITATLTAQTDYPFRTSPYLYDVGAILITSSGRLQASIIDDVTSQAVAAFNETDFGVGFFWQQQSVSITPDYLAPGGRYLLRLAPVDPDPDYTVEWFNQ